MGGIVATHGKNIVEDNDYKDFVDGIITALENE
jgi:hypothetical protein